MSVMIYGVVCQASSIALNAFEAGNVSTTSAAWNFSAGFTQQPALNVSGTILGPNIPGNTNSWTTDTVSYKTPYQLTMISGDGQTGTAYQYLPKPLQVQVTDNNGNAQANVPVYFAITSGGGSLSIATVMTNSSGYAQTSWQIGNPAMSSQSVQASVKTANGAQISGSPVSFLAY